MDPRDRSPLCALCGFCTHHDDSVLESRLCGDLPLRPRASEEADLVSELERRLRSCDEPSAECADFLSHLREVAPLIVSLIRNAMLARHLFSVDFDRHFLLDYF